MPGAPPSRRPRSSSAAACACADATTTRPGSISSSRSVATARCCARRSGSASAATWARTRICPHSLTHRPVVVDADEDLAITYAGPEGVGPATLSVDGLWTWQLAMGDEVRIHRASVPLQLVPPKASMFDVLA